MLRGLRTDNGTICHVHRVVTMEGAKNTSEQEMEARTLHLAKELGLNVENLHIVHVDSRVFAPGMRYSVNPQTRKLVGTPVSHS